VRIDLDASYRLPWYATVGLAEKRIRDELTKVLREHFPT
jgi:hypothetical protein